MESKAKWSRPADEIIAFYVAQETAVEKRTGVSRQKLSAFFVRFFIVYYLTFPLFEGSQRLLFKTRSSAIKGQIPSSFHTFVLRFVFVLCKFRRRSVVEGC